MAGIEPYLIFDGNCEEAVKLYCDVFGGEVLFTSRYKDAPMGDTPKDWQEKIIHTTFVIRGTQIMASDSHDSKNKTTFGNNIHLCANFKKEDKGFEEAFNKLATGGKMTMPLQKTFWGANFGMLTDKYGNCWMFSQYLEEKK